MSEDAGSDTDYKHCLEEQEVSELVSNEGEVRFPIRNWITPKKSDYSTTTEDQSEQIKDLLQRVNYNYNYNYKKPVNQYLIFYDLQVILE